MAEWWDIGHQFQRASNAFANHHGMAGSVTTNPNDYDIWGNVKPGAKPKNTVVGAPQSALYQAIKYEPSKGPLSIEAYENKPLKPAAPATPAPTGFYYNNVPVSEADYRRLTAPQAPAAQPVTTAIQQQGTSYLEKLLSNIDRREAERDAVRDRITNAANPYAPGSENFARIRGAMMDKAVGSYSQQKALAQGRIGGLASGLRQASSDAMTRGLLTAYGQIEAQLLERGAAYESDRNRSLMQLASGDYTGAGSALQSILSASLGQSNADRSFGLDLDANRRANETNSVQLDIARQQLRSYAQQANMDEATYTERLKAKKQEYELAVIEGRAKIWEAENAHWLKPLEAVAPYLGYAIGASGLLPFKLGG